MPSCTKGKNRAYSGAVIVLTVAMLLAPASPAECVESAVAGKLEEFTDGIIASLVKRAPASAPVAIANFDEKDDRARRSDLGFAVSEIMTERFSKSGKFLIVEKQQLAKIVKTLELGQTGLYNYDRVAAVGRLVGARYLVVGSVLHLAGFYRVAVRVVEVETGAVILSDTVEIDTQMLENAAEKYQPPRYRFTVGSSMNWYGSDYEGSAIYTIGLSGGYWYQLFRNQWVSLIANYHFGYYYIQRNEMVGTDGVNMSYAIRNAFVALAGYGYRFNLTRVLSVQPGLFGGWVLGSMKTDNLFSPNAGLSETYTSSETYSSAVFQPRVDFVFNEQNPLSFFANIGYFYHMKGLSKTYHGLTIDREIQGVKIEGGVMFYL